MKRHFKVSSDLTLLEWFPTKKAGAHGEYQVTIASIFASTKW